MKKELTVNKSRSPLHCRDPSSGQCPSSTSWVSETTYCLLPHPGVLCSDLSRIRMSLLCLERSWEKGHVESLLPTCQNPAVLLIPPLKALLCISWDDDRDRDTRIHRNIHFDREEKESVVLHFSAAESNDLLHPDQQLSWIPCNIQQYCSGVQS